LAAGLAGGGFGAAFAFSGRSIESGCALAAGGGGASGRDSAGAGSAAGFVSLAGTPSVSRSEFQRSGFPGSVIFE
jgi:hypothetical protein